MDLKPIGIILIVIAGMAALSGCTATTGPTPQGAVMTPDTITPVRTPILITPLPVDEVARIEVDHFGMNPSTETVYEFVGKIHVNNGPYQSVKVILRYPDTQEYTYDAGGMGGANATLKPFYLYPADRYKGTNPEKIVELDTKRYGTVYNYNEGVISWISRTNNEISA